MDTAESTIRSLSAGRVLDVATGSGQFITFLIENLKDYDEIIGIDNSDKAAAAFAGAFKDNPQVRFMKMDASKVDYPEASFDTVCISNSMHHMPAVGPVLAEMMRLLRPRGYFIVAEMVRDNQMEAQMTHVLLHHWWAAVDTASGITHHETYTRRQILEIIGNLGLNELLIDEVSDLNGNPKEPETIQYLTGVIDQYLQRIVGLPGEAVLRERGLELRQRVEQVGFQSATNLLCIGRKP